MYTKVNMKGMSQGKNMSASWLLSMILSHIDHLIENRSAQYICVDSLTGTGRGLVKGGLRIIMLYVCVCVYYILYIMIYGRMSLQTHTC